MKTCIISPTFPDMNCGVGDYTARLAENIAGFISKLTVITLDNPKIKRTKGFETTKNVEIQPVVKKWNFLRLFLLIKKIKSLKPDVIHIQYHWFGYNDGLILKGVMITTLPLLLKVAKINCLVVITLHSHLWGPYLFPGAGFLRRWALVPMLLFCDKIIFTNKFDTKSLCNWLTFIKRKVVSIAGGAGHYLKDDSAKGDAEKIRLKLKRSADEIILSNFGYMIPYKGLEELLEAMSILREKGYPVRLLGIGGWDIDTSFAPNYFNELQDEVDSLNLRPYVTWTGFCKPKRASAFLLASDMCVMPFTEGVSELRSSFIGVLSYGLPVITTYTEKTPEELIDHENALLVPPRNHFRLAEAIEELVNCPQLRKKIGRAAKRLYDERYSWDVIAEKTLRVYKNNND